MFTVGLGPVVNSAFAVSTMLIAVPTGIKIFNWIATMWGGSIDIKSPMLFSLGFIALFIIGGLSGVTHAAPPSDAQQQDTYYIVAHLHYVLFGGSVFGVFAGIYYWFPKMTGRMLNEGLAKLNFWLMFIGMNLTFAPMHWVGLDGMPRRVYTYTEEMGWDFWNLVSTIGSLTLAVGLLVFLHNFFRSLKKGEIAGNDPWDGRTLEWTIPSPPPEYNFAEIPVVTSRDDYWHQKYIATSDGRMTLRTTGAGEDKKKSDPAHIHMPGLSYFPIIAAFGLTLVAAGLIARESSNLIGFAAMGIGLIGTLMGIYGWAFEPADPED